MPGLYSHTTRAAGLTLTATIYNTDHQNHIDNQEPQQMDDYSSSVAQMKIITDPGEVGSESQANSLSGELERIRFMFKAITGKAQWYENDFNSFMNIDKGLIEIISPDGGAGGGPDLILYRNSASPAASDPIGRILFDGEDDGGGRNTYAQIQGEIADPTAASEDGNLQFFTMVAGTLTNTMNLIGVNLVVGTLTVGPGSIIDSSGAISFGNENLSTTGTLAAGATTLSGLFKANADNTIDIGTSSVRFRDIFSARVKVLDGTLALPSHSFVNDPDTGLWRPGTNILDLVTAGSSRLRFSATGTVTGNSIASAAEADAGAVAKIVTTTGLEESRKRFRGRVSTGTVNQTLPITWTGNIIIYSGASAATWTIDDDGWTEGDVLTIIQKGAGQITLVKGTFGTLTAPNGLKTAQQGSIITIVFESSSIAYVGGDISA